MRKFDHHFFMQKALLQASVAYKRNEVPVGAVVVDPKGNIVGRGHNIIESARCQIGHAEVVAIQKACKKIGTWRLDGCCIYVTLEPCLMCLGLIQLSRIKALYFGATCPEFGSGIAQATRYKLYKKDLIIKGGFREEECIQILKEFFVKLRKNKKG